MQKNIFITITCLILLSFFGGYYFSPYVTVDKMRQAALEGNSITLSSYVNFPSLKESLKANINATLAKDAVTSHSSDKSGALGAVIAGAFANPLIDALVTPENLAVLMQKGNLSINKENSNREVTMGYEGFDKFAISIKAKGDTHTPLILLLHREGMFTWRLSSVQLPAKVFASSNAEITHQADQINETSSNNKPSAEAPQSEKVIAAKNAEPHEEIISPPAIERENTANNNPSPPSLCKPNEFSHLNAKLSGENTAPNAIKLLSICVKQKTEPFDTVIYRFGTENNVELEKIASETSKFYIYTQQTTPHTGENVIFFNNGAYTYCITESLGQARGIGLVVIKENKKLLDLYSGLNEGFDYDGEVGIDFEKSKSPALKIIDSRDADPCAIRYR